MFFSTNKYESYLFTLLQHALHAHN